MRLLVLVGVIAMAVLQSSCSGAEPEPSLVDVVSSASVTVPGVAVDGTPAADAGETDAATATPTTAVAVPCEQPLCLRESVSMLNLLGRPIEDNVLKLFGAAVGSSDDNLYVSGIMSSHIGVLDTASGDWVGTIDTGIHEHSLKYIYSAPGHGWLYVAETGSGTLRRIDLDTGEVDGIVDIPSLTDGHRAAVDPVDGLLILATKDGGLQAFGGDEFGLVWQQASLGERAGSLVFDEGSGLLYVVDPTSSAAERELFVVDAASGETVRTVLYGAPEGDRSRWLMLDSDGRRLIVGTDRAAVVIGLDGAPLGLIRFERDSVVSSMVFDAEHGRIAVLTSVHPSDPGQVASTEGRLDVYDASTGRRIDSITFGRKPKRMILNPADGQIYVPNGDASIVWRIDTETYAEAEALRLGDSVEQVAIAGNGNLYLSSRLGGSYLIEYDPATGSFATFETGAWPIPVQTDDAGGRLLVVNAWESSLSVFDVSGERRLLATVDLGLPEGSTDRLPSMAVDSLNSVAYVGYPEFGAVVAIDFAMMEVVGSIELDGFQTGDTGGGPGQLQLAVDEDSGRLFVLWAAQRRLDVYDSSTFELLATLGTGDIDWKAVPRAGNYMYLDAAAGRLFLGPVEIETETLEPTGRELGRGLSVVAKDSGRGIYWAVSDEVHPKLAAVSVAALETVYEAELPGSHVLPPVVAFDAERDVLYVGHQAEAQLDVFAVGEGW
ncbi:MAG: YncE family protein [Dehalococcoidia bacterium]